MKGLAGHGYVVEPWCLLDRVGLDRVGADHAGALRRQGADMVVSDPAGLLESPLLESAR